MSIGHVVEKRLHVLMWATLKDCEKLIKNHLVWWPTDDSQFPYVAFLASQLF